MVQMNFSNARKAPAKRAFSGMVGREAPADPKSSDDKARYVPASEQRFQSTHHDPDNFRASQPVATRHIQHAKTGFAKVVQDITGVNSGELKNVGLSVFQAGSVSRTDTPDWIKDPSLIDEYFERRLQQKTHGEFLISRELDRLILTDYFLSNHTDEIIFRDHETNFKKERRKLGRVERWTSSPDAVKHRRDRLLRDRERLYEPPKPWTRSSWRGILASTPSGEWGAPELHGIATQKRKRKASKIADYYGLVGRFQEPAEIIAEPVFEDRPALDSWMTEHGIALDDIITDDLNWA
jgi:hypothetical protein